MVRHLTAEMEQAVVDCVLAGRTDRAIYALTGVARQTIRGVVARRGLARPDCPCGRPGGHKGMCLTRRAEERHERPSSPSWNVAPARTRLGSLLDAHCARRGIRPADLARLVGVTPLMLNHLRHGHRRGGVLVSRAVVDPGLLDRVAGALGLDEYEGYLLHRAAALDWGFRVDYADRLVADAGRLASAEAEGKTRAAYERGLAAGRASRVAAPSIFAGRAARVPEPGGPRRTVELEDLQLPVARSATGSSLA